MRLLLDTHALIWWFAGDKKLAITAKKQIDDPANLIFVSAVTSWELATKYRIGKLPEAEYLIKDLFGQLQKWHFKKLPVSVEHGHFAGLLPGEHKDPFDRMLAAQSIMEDMAVVTIDPALAGLGAKVIW